jgi:hypothetical protein
VAVWRSGAKIGDVGKQNMKLIDAILLAIQPEVRSTVFAREPWTLDAEAMFIDAIDGVGIPKGIVPEGFKYFLEAHVMQEFVDERVRSKLTDAQIVDMVIHYATHDAFPDWANELLTF